MEIGYTLILGLSKNYTLFLVAFYLYGRILPYVDRLSKRHKTWTLGALFSMFVIIEMSMNIELHPGVNVDSRGVIIALSGVVGGVGTLLITGAAAALFRLWLGGAGAYAGVGIVVGAMLLGALFNLLLKRNIVQDSLKNYALFGMVLAVETLGWVIWVPPFDFGVFKELFIPVMFFYPLATLVGLYLFEQSKTEYEMKRKLENSELEYSAMFKNNPVAIWVEDLSSVYNITREYINAGYNDVYEYLINNPDELFRCSSAIIVNNVNDASCKMLGAKNKEELLGNLDKTFVPKSFTAMAKNVMAVSQGLLSFETEAEIQTLDGKPIQVVLAWVVVPGYEEDYSKVIVTFADITKRVGYEEKLRRFEKAINEVDEAIIIADEKGNMIYVNDSVKKITGYTPEETLGENPRMFQSGKHGVGFYKDLWATLTKGFVWRGVFINRRKDRTLYYEDTTITPVLTDDGSVFYVAVKRDVTRKREMEERFRQSQKLEAIGLLAGGIAHDFNNILAAIVHSVELLGNPKVGLNEKAKAYLKVIDKSATQAELLVKKILSFGRTSSEEKVIVDLGVVIEDTLAIFERTLNKNIAIECTNENDGLTVDADRAALQNCFMNLGINAAHAMPNGGTLNISLKKCVLDEHYCEESSSVLVPGNYIEIIFSDSGVGISEDDQKKIFQPFFTTRDADKGTGLGLAAVHGIIEDHGGEIIVESELGKGARFIMHLPYVYGEVEKALAPPAPESGSGVVLLVDDEETLRFVAEQLLEDLGYQVLTAENGEEAIDLYEKNKGTIDIVITDMIMPGLSGADTFYRLKEIDQEAKVVVASGFAEESTVRELKKNGLKGFIQKPYNTVQMSQLIAEVMKKD